MDKVFKYYAFISYKHEDEKWAKWLQKRLETYRLPVALQKQNCPKHLKPVFRDNTDITPGNLEEKLHENLELSNYLIVICSKNLAKESHYVDYEMQTFMNLGRSDKIIPFIVDGEPNADNPNEECFSRFIKDFPGELLAANAKKDGKRTAALKVIASILKLNADDLIKRDKKRKRVQRFAGVMLAIIAMIFLSSTLDLSAQNYEKEAINSSLYSDYTSAIKYAIKSLSVPFNKNDSGEAAQILRSRVIADELKKSNSQFTKEYEIKAKSKYLALFVESADGTKVGFTDLSRVFVYDSATGEFLREFHKENEKDELEEFMGIEIDDDLHVTTNSNYNINKEPVKHSESVENSDVLSKLCIYDKNGVLEYSSLIVDGKTRWIYNESESLIALYTSQSTPFIEIYSFDSKKSFAVYTPDNASGMPNMYFSPEGRYLFAEFSNSETFGGNILLVYDLESRRIVFECNEEDECYEFWTFSKSDNRQSLYVFSSYKVEKYTYADKAPEVNNVLYSSSDELTVYTKNNEHSNIFFSDDGSRAVSVNYIINRENSDNRTLYTFFDPHSGESFTFAYFTRGDDVIDITPDIKYSIMFFGNRIEIVEIENCETIFEVECDNESIQSVAISKDGRRAAYLNDQAVLTILTLEEDGNYKSQTASSPQPDDCAYKEIVFINDKECLTNFDGLIRAYDIESGNSRTITEDAWNNINVVYANRFDIFSSCKDLSESGMVLETLDIDQFYAFYSIEGGNVDAYDNALVPCDYSPRTGLLAGAEHTNQEMYNSEIVVIHFDKSTRNELYRHSSNIEVEDVIMDNNGKYIILNGPEGCEVLDALTGDLLFTLDRNILIHDDIVYDISGDLVLPDALPCAEICSVNEFIQKGEDIVG